MSVITSFEKLNSILHCIESAGWRIEHVELPKKQVNTEEPLKAEIGVSLPLQDILQDGSDVQIKGLNIEDSNNVITVTIPTGERDASGDSDEETREKTAEEDTSTGTQSEERDASKRRATDRGGEVHVEESEGATPPHHDPKQLREVYENHDTFTEMTNALGVDVSPQTVRHFMIRHGIHEPSTYSSAEAKDMEGSSKDIGLATDSGSSCETKGKRDDEVPSDDTDDVDDREPHSNDDTGPTTPTKSDERIDEDVTADPSIGEISPERLEEVPLPDGVSINELKEAVQSASAMYQVRQALDLEGEEARELLQELNLLDLVTGRLAYKPNQDKSLDEIETAADSTEEIEKRIHQALNA